MHGESLSRDDKRGLCRSAASVCLSVLLSVTFVYCVKMSNHVLNFSVVYSHNIPVFPHQTLRQYSDGESLTGAKIAIFDQYLPWNRRLIECLV